MLIGYARVSTADQNSDLQEDSLIKAGCEKIYTDKIGGTVSDRPGWIPDDRSFRDPSGRWAQLPRKRDHAPGEAAQARIGIHDPLFGSGFRGPGAVQNEEKA